jgi:hypothetical protein
MMIEARSDVRIRRYLILTFSTLTKPLLREPEKTNIPFYITPSGRLCRSFNRKILNVALLRLRFCSIRNDKSDLNPSVKPGISVYSGSLIFIVNRSAALAGCAGKPPNR